MRASAFHLAAVLLVSAGIVGSIFAFRAVRDTELTRAEAEFHRRVAVLHTRFSDILGGYDDTLYSLRTAFTLDGGVSAPEFTHLARDLAERSPGVQAFEWIPVTTAAQRPALEAALREESGGRIVQFTELKHGRLVPAGERADYLPIRYVYPYLGNEDALGLDLRIGTTWTDLRSAAAKRDLVLTRQVTLVQEKEDRRGLIMIWPVFRRAGPSGTEELTGFVQGVFRVHDMLETLRRRTWSSQSILDVLFIDTSEPDPSRQILYYRPNSVEIAPSPPPTAEDFRRGLHEEADYHLGGRTWKMLYRPYAGWQEEQLAPLRWVRTAGIMTISILAAGLVLLVGRRTEVIQREVAERTAELTESRRQLSSLFRSLPGIAYRCRYDDQLKVIYVSDGVEALTGHPVADFLSGAAHFRTLIHPDDVDRVRQLTRAGLAARTEIEIEYRLVTRHGAEKWVLSRGRGVYGDDGRPLFLEGLAIDITERKQAEAGKLALERRMLESQKLESLGLLAGGIAHDFNNILTGILGNASLARMRLPPDAPLQNNLHKIELGSARAAELCQQMLSYTGKSSFRVAPVDLGRLIEDTLPLLHVSLGSRARLHLDLSPEPAVSLADATQLRQIVMNLVINAVESMSDGGGEVFVATGLRPVDQEFLNAAHDGEVLAPGTFAFIEVRDTGCGMAPEILTRIFDPFFTTKFAGRGLGLAAVRGIVRGHQGALHVMSKPGGGSTFTLLLPPTDRPVPAAARPAGPTRSHHGHVLVIDDEAHVREAAADLLATFGFTTAVAADGAEGLAQFALNPTGFAFVMLDLTMPHLGGEETLAALRAIIPEVRVLMISGYSENTRIAKLASTGALRFLQKPFTRDDLEQKIRELVGEG